MDQEVQQRLESLEGALRTTMRRIRELEEELAAHHGLDYGADHVDANSPHRNLSVDTIESGGGLIRQDVNGMQVQAATQTTGMYFVSSLSSDPESDTRYAYVAGRITPALDQANLYLGTKNSTSEVYIRLLAHPSMSTIDMFVGSFLIATMSQIDGSNTGMCSLSLNSGGVLRIGPGRTSVPTDWQDGDITYRSDTQKYIVRINATTENLATESYASAPSATWALPGDISPAQITVNQNDYNPTGLSTASVLRLSSDASRDITGLAGGADGRILLLFNVGSFNIVLKDESASSTAANRFALNGDLTLQPDNSVILWYDSTSTRWRAV